MPNREPPVKPRQLTFDLPVDSRHGVEDFLVAHLHDTLGPGVDDL